MNDDTAVQTLRALACVLVVAGHVVGSSPSSGMQLGEGTVLRDFVDLVAPLRLPLFTFLSGFVYAYRPVIRGRIGLFSRRKLQRLGIPLVTVTTIYLLLSFVAGDVRGKVPIDEAWKVYFFSYVHFWFLQAILLVFAGVVVLEMIGALARFGTFLTTVALATVASVLIPLYPEGSFLSFDGAIRLLPFFLLGLGAHRFRSMLQRRGVASVCALIFVLAGAAHSSIALEIGTVAPWTLAVVVGMTGVLALIYFMPRLRWLEPFGAYSFAVYLFHPFAVAPTRLILQALHAGHQAVIFTLCLAAGLIGPVIVDHLARRVPIARMLLLGERRSARTPPVEPLQGRPAAALQSDSAPL